MVIEASCAFILSRKLLSNKQNFAVKVEIHDYPTTESYEKLCRYDNTKR